jgi:hypothetical protein
MMDQLNKPANLEELAQWADAAVELFPVHGERFQEIARVLRAGVAQTPSAGPVAYRVKDFADGWILCHTLEVGHLFSGRCLIQPLYLGPAQAALNPGMREALERIRDFPIGGHTAAAAMALIARQALASPPPSQ